MPKDEKEYPLLPNLTIYQASKLAQENREHQEDVRRNDEEKRQKEKEVDRKFAAMMLIIGAIIGALVVKLFDIFFK